MKWTTPIRYLNCLRLIGQTHPPIIRRSSRTTKYMTTPAENHRWTAHSLLNQRHTWPNLSTYTHHTAQVHPRTTLLHTVPLVRDVPVWQDLPWYQKAPRETLLTSILKGDESLLVWHEYHTMSVYDSIESASHTVSQCAALKGFQLTLTSWHRSPSYNYRYICLLLTKLDIIVCNLAAKKIIAPKHHFRTLIWITKEAIWVGNFTNSSHELIADLWSFWVKPEFLFCLSSYWMNGDIIWRARINCIPSSTHLFLPYLCVLDVLIKSLFA